MACSRCTAARQAASRAIRSAASGRLTEAASAARTALYEIKSKVAESDRIRSITRRKPHG